jgi:nucleoid DNA-binding protein
MNKKEIAARLASRASITNVKAQEILNHLFDAENGIIGDALAADDQKAAKVLFAGFGTFERRTRAPRVGTNPATGKPLNIPQKQFVSFKPGKTLKERIAALKG